MSKNNCELLARFSPEGKSRGAKAGLWLLTFLVLLGASVGLGLMCLYFSAGSYRDKLFSFYMSQPKLVILNVVPFVVLAMLVWLLSNRAWVGFLTSGVVCLAYSWAEYWTLLSRSEPIYAEELLLIREAARMSTRYISFTFRFWLSLGLVILGTLVLAAFFRGRLGHWSLRVILPLLVLVGAWQLYDRVYMNQSLYNSFQVMPGMNIYLDNNRFLSRGGMYPFLYSTRALRPTPPEGYSAAEAREILEQYTTDPIPEDKKVSVICVMLEAFSDLSDYSEMIPQEPYADFHALQAESYTGKLVTNIFAGGTVDTERCVVTGYSRVGSSFYRPAWSYARYFADNGYSLNGSHPCYASFYSRSVVNKNLGFPEYYFLENHYEAISGGISMDRDLMPEITRLCKEQMAEGPVFSFNVTYQNHGPYSTEEFNMFARQERISGEGLNEEAYYVVNNYLNGVAETGARMREMTDAFRDSAEPVILVFFGDHKPWLGNQGSIYPMLGIDFESGTDQSFYNYYCTEYMFWANDAAKKTLGCDFTGQGPMVSPCFLMNVLFDLCGWEGPGYQKLTDQVMAQLPIVSTKDRCCENGTLTAAASLSDANKALLDEMIFAQYYLTKDAAAKLPG